LADWTALSNTAVGVGGLPSGATVTALRDNPVAIAEGAAGAPNLLIGVGARSIAFAVGTYIIGRPQNSTNYVIDSLVAGSILYATTTSDYVSGTSFIDGTIGGTPVVFLASVGTWRCTSPARGNGSFGTIGLWVRTV
jgi:hypothetical protein